MVQALVIRQVFLLIDFILVIAVLVTAAVVTRRLFTPPEAQNLAAAPLDLPAVEARPMLLDIDNRAGYDAILQQRLFGAAGTWNPDAVPPPPPPPPEPEEVETDLNLRRLGVSAISPQDPMGSAVIQDLDVQRSAPGVYWLGQPVMEEVSLLEVHPRMVILENRRKSPPTRERLSMYEESEEQQQYASARPGPTVPASMPSRLSAATDRIELQREDLMQELYVNYADLVTKLRPEMKTDERGNVVGITAQNISQIPLAQKLGLQDGDILQSINNERIDSEQKITEIMTKYQNAASFRIGIQRNGQAKVITYRLN